MSKPFFITTAIDYTNGAPHIGHAYEKVLADVIARYHRLKGDEVFFLTGVDQHGQKVQQSADKQGVAPQQFVDEITAKFVALWKKLGVDYSAWAETTYKLHKDNVSINLQKLWDKKDPATGKSFWLYKKTQRGFYSVRQEQFLTDKERNEQGEFGPEWQPVEERDEENFYFRLTQDPETGAPGFDPKQWLLNLIDARSAQGKPLVVPEFRVAELRNAVEKIEGDLCISRPASRLKWGIPFPDLDGEGVGFVTYVWFDALVNYISFVPGHDPNHSELGAGQETEFAKWWGAALHVIGKDILIPAHGVYWPIMLKAFEYADEEIPTLLVHGWWNIAGSKMSKSLGNIVDPDALADKYGAEALRYYLMSDIATGRDADFSEERLVMRYNTDLANSLGNLLNRTLNMANKYYQGKLFTSDYDDPLLATCRRSFEILANYFKYWINRGEPVGSHYAISFGLDLIFGRGRHDIAVNFDQKSFSMGLVEEADEYPVTLDELGVARGNRLVDKTAPWLLAKDPSKSDQLDAVLYTLAESLRIIAILISPVLPKAAAGIFAQLNWNGPMTLDEAVWGKLPDGHVLGKPTPLFPRIEAPAA